MKKNIMLFGILTLLFLLSISVASALVETSPFNIDSNDGTYTAKTGHQIKATSNITVENVTKVSGSTPTTAYILSVSNVTLATATFSGNVATFSGGYELSENTYYYLVVDSGGSGYTLYRDITDVTYPQTGDVIDWTKGDSQQSGQSVDVETAAYHFTEIGYSQDSESPPFQITAVNEWNGSSINSFWAYVDGTNYSTTNGTIVTTLLQNDTNTYNVLMGSTDYFSKEYDSVVVSSNFQGSLFQSEINFQTTELISNNTLTNLTYTINGQANTTFHLSEGEYTVLVQKTGYYDLNHTFNVSALDNRTETIEGLYNAILSVNLTDVVTTDLIESNSYLTINDNDGYVETFSNSNGSISANLLQGNYSLTAWADNYAFHYANITINDTTQGVSYALYANNSVWVTAVDFNDGSNLNNFTVEVYNANQTYSVSDGNTGTAKLNNITSGVYTLRVDKDGYSVAEYPLTMTGGSHQNVVAYMVASGSETIFTVVDVISGAIIEGAQASMYKTINSSWTLVSSQDTDITGRVQFSYIPNIEYKFVVDAGGYEQRTFFLKPLFSTYTIRLTPDTQSEPDVNVGSWVYEINNSGQFYDGQNNSFTISITSGTGTIEYYYLNVTDPDGSSQNVTCVVAGGCSDDFVLEIVGSDYNDTVVVEYIIKESGRSAKSFKKTYIVQDIYDPSTLWGWSETDGVDGMGDLEKVLVATIISLVVVGFVSIASVYIGVPPVTPSGVVLAVTVEILGLVGFIPMYSAHLVALGCILIVLFGRGEI